MQYYAFELEDESSEIYKILTSFGKFEYNKLPMPMDLKCSPNYGQVVMEKIFHNLEDTDVCIDI